MQINPVERYRNVSTQLSIKKKKDVCVVEKKIINEKKERGREGDVDDRSIGLNKSILRNT